MASIGIFFVIAALSGAVWECVKGVIPGNVPSHIDRLSVILIAVFVTVSAGIQGAKTDLFAQYGLKLPYFSGFILTGIICSKGANYLHDLVTNKLQTQAVEEKFPAAAIVSLPNEDEELAKLRRHNAELLKSITQVRKITDKFLRL